MNQNLTDVYCTCGMLLYRVDESRPCYIEIECPKCGIILRRGNSEEFDFSNHPKIKEVFIKIK